MSDEGNTGWVNIEELTCSALPPPPLNPLPEIIPAIPKLQSGKSFSPTSCDVITFNPGGGVSIGERRYSLPNPMPETFELTIQTGGRNYTLTSKQIAGLMQQNPDGFSITPGQTTHGHGQQQEGFSSPCVMVRDGSLEIRSNSPGAEQNNPVIVNSNNELGDYLNTLPTSDTPNLDSILSPRIDPSGSDWKYTC